MTNFERELKDGFIFYAVMTLLFGAPQGIALRLVAFIGYMFGWMLFAYIKFAFFN
jgi:hypothetical protein